MPLEWYRYSHVMRMEGNYALRMVSVQSCNENGG